MSKRCTFPSKYGGGFTCGNWLPCSNPDHAPEKETPATPAETCDMRDEDARCQRPKGHAGRHAFALYVCDTSEKETPAPRPEGRTESAIKKALKDRDAAWAERDAAIQSRDEARREAERFRKQGEADWNALCRPLAWACRLSPSSPEPTRAVVAVLELLEKTQAERDALREQVRTLTQERDALAQEIARVKATANERAQVIAKLTGYEPQPSEPEGRCGAVGSAGTRCDLPVGHEGVHRGTMSVLLFGGGRSEWGSSERPSVAPPPPAKPERATVDTLASNPPQYRAGTSERPVGPVRKTREEAQADADSFNNAPRCAECGDRIRMDQLGLWWHDPVHDDGHACAFATPSREEKKK